MLIALSFLALLAGGNTVHFPGGRIDLPKGCTGPDRIRIAVDAFAGQIGCSNNELSIQVFGSTIAGPACEVAQAAGDAVSIRSRSGSPLVVCTYEEKGEARRGSKLMIVDLGVGWLTADIKRPQDVVVLLQVATGFSPSKE